MRADELNRVVEACAVAYEALRQSQASVTGSGPRPCPNRTLELPDRWLKVVATDEKSKHTLA